MSKYLAAFVADVKSGRAKKFLGTVIALLIMIGTQVGTDSSVAKYIAIAVSALTAISTYGLSNKPAAVGEHEAGIIETSVVWTILAILLIVAVVIWILNQTGHA